MSADMARVIRDLCHPQSNAIKYGEDIEEWLERSLPQALAAAGFGNVREQQARLDAVRDLANWAGKHGWTLDAAAIRKALEANK